MRRLCYSVVFAAAFCLATLCAAQTSSPADTSSEPNLTLEQKEQFLLNSNVVNSKRLGKGVTHPWRLTLTDGRITHDAVFQTVDVRMMEKKFDDGRTELNFIDSYRYNIAAYKLSKLVGMDDMIAVYVERRWKGDPGSLSWWIPWKWDEAMRRQQDLHPPDPDSWNHQMYKIRVFDQLVYDTDPNLTNVLITSDWKIWRIDFTRAFRLNHDLQAPQDLTMCDRQLLAKLRQLDGATVLENIKPFLTKGEVKALMVRRDKLVSNFDKLVAAKGEGAVLY